MARRFRTEKHGRIETPNYLDDKIGAVMNLLDASAQTAISYILEKSIDVFIDGLREFENKASEDVKKIFSSVLKEKYQFTKKNGKTTIKKI